MRTLIAAKDSAEAIATSIAQAGRTTHVLVDSTAATVADLRAQGHALAYRPGDWDDGSVLIDGWLATSRQSAAPDFRLALVLTTKGRAVFNACAWNGDNSPERLVAYFTRTLKPRDRDFFTDAAEFETMVRSYHRDTPRYVGTGRLLSIKA